MVVKSLLTYFLMLILTASCTALEVSQEISKDICIYGATPAGINAAIAAKREGKSAVIVEPSRWVGGILGAGISPVQDCSTLDAVGGLAREQIISLGRKTPIKYEGMPFKKVHNTYWPVPPQNIRRDYLKLLKKHNIKVIYDHRVERCIKKNGRITTAVFDEAPFDSLGCPPAEASKKNSVAVSAKVFIDASYEGNLMVRSGVSYRAGRESRSEFNEAHAGVTKLDLVTEIDPFVERGNPASGLLKGVENNSGNIGEGDDYTQAYNYRYSATRKTAERSPIEAPDNYKANDYELAGRYVEYLLGKNKANSLWDIIPMWHLTTNYRRNSLVTQAPLGISRFFADGDYQTQAKVWKQHQDYLRGLYHFMCTDKRVPEKFRKELGKFGLNKKHFPDTNGWPHQLYIRTARKLKGKYTLSEKDIYNKGTAPSVIAYGLYGIDIYPVRRVYVKKGDKHYVGVEGWMFVGHQNGPTGKPYPIPYEALIPQEKECSNLIVPVCFSGTHLAYASARMEPVFMICGESAGIAAVQAINEKVPVQKINMDTYKKSLLKFGQVLTLPENVNNMKSK